jgi:hypothetical protein
MVESHRKYLDFSWDFMENSWAMDGDGDEMDERTPCDLSDKHGR